MKGQPIADRLWGRAQRDPLTGCLIYPSTTGRHATIWITGRAVGAHRAAWELVNGPIPEALQVLHRCDNPPCIETTHLFLGTQLDNIRDMHAKGRARGGSGAGPGESNPNHKLTERQVALAKRALLAGTSALRLAADLGVAPGTIYHIRNGTNWRHVAPAV